MVWGLEKLEEIVFAEKLLGKWNFVFYEVFGVLGVQDDFWLFDWVYKRVYMFINVWIDVETHLIWVMI